MLDNNFSPYDMLQEHDQNIHHLYTVIDRMSNNMIKLNEHNQALTAKQYTLEKNEIVLNVDEQELARRQDTIELHYKQQVSSINQLKQQVNKIHIDTFTKVSQMYNDMITLKEQMNDIQNQINLNKGE